MKYLLDTNALSEPARRRPSPRFMEKLTRFGAALSTSVLCVGEMLYGARRGRGAPRYEAYLREVVLPTMPVLDVDVAVAARYAEVRADEERAVRSHADIDLLLAATALHHGLVLVTHNVRDFADIAGLDLEDWTAAA